METDKETTEQAATISAGQEQLNTIQQGETMAECGEVTFNVTKKYSKDGYQAIKELKQKIKEMKLDIPEMSYPQVEDEPGMNMEYHTCLQMYTLGYFLVGLVMKLLSLLPLSSHVGLKWFYFIMTVDS
jgi:hypothetical protein